MRGGAPLVWAILVAATLTSWWLAEGHCTATAGSVAVILIAAFKINLVVAHFMDLGWQPAPFRIIVSAWIALATAILIGGLLLA
jgi:Prokaryotic Cytochrome C oxidase subunit IV